MLLTVAMAMVAMGDVCSRPYALSQAAKLVIVNCQAIVVIYCCHGDGRRAYEVSRPYVQLIGCYVGNSAL